MFKTATIPTLAESSFLRYFNFIALYFTEGLPMGMLFVGIPAWMAMEGKTATEIGGFAVACSLPWTFKFIVAPLMDRYTYLPMGRKRPWVLFGQFGLIFGLIGMSRVTDPLNNLDALMVAAFIVSALGAIQDAASDGMAVDVIPDHQQARANGYMQGARMIGSSLALALGSWILNTYSFQASMLTLAAMISVVTLVPVLLKERPGEKMLPFTSGRISPESEKMQVNDWGTILKALFSVFTLKNSLLVVLLLFITQGSYNYFETLLPLFTVKVTGWTNVYYSQVFAIADLVGGVLGMLAGGYLIEKFGKKRMINTYFLLIIALVVALSFLKTFWTNSTFMYGYIVTYRLLNAFAKIGLFSIAMQFCSRSISASQFTIFMTLGATGSIVGAAFIGPVKENFGWEMTFLFFAGMIGLALVVLQFVNIDAHIKRINEMDRETAERQLVEIE